MFCQVSTTSSIYLSILIESNKINSTDELIKIMIMCRIMVVIQIQEVNISTILLLKKKPRSHQTN